MFIPVIGVYFYRWSLYFLIFHNFVCVCFLFTYSSSFDSFTIHYYTSFPLYITYFYSCNRGIACCPVLLWNIIKSNWFLFLSIVFVCACFVCLYFTFITGWDGGIGRETGLHPNVSSIAKCNILYLKVQYKPFLNLNHLINEPIILL